MDNIIKDIEMVEILLKKIKSELKNKKILPENGALNEAPSLELEANKALRRYEQIIGLVTPAVVEGVDFVIKEGMEAELVIRIIEYACEQGKRNWQYINAVLLGSLKEKILTLDDFKRRQAERAERNAAGQPSRKLMRSKFNNYDDTNKTDYSKFSEDILSKMLEE